MCPEKLVKGNPKLLMLLFQNCKLLLSFVELLLGFIELPLVGQQFVDLLLFDSDLLFTSFELGLYRFDLFAEFLDQLLPACLLTS